MLLNNIEKDIKLKCIDLNINQVELGKKIHTTGQYVNRITKGRVTLINKTFIDMFEAMGYDIEINYIKKKNNI